MSNLDSPLYTIAFPVVGNMIAIFLFLSPMKEIMQRRKAGENGNLNSYPHIMMFSQALGWVIYSCVINAPLLGFINLV